MSRLLQLVGQADLRITSSDGEAEILENINVYFQ